MSETPSPCLVKCRELAAAVEARILGKQVQSVGHKSRNLSYADVSTEDLIAYYRQHWLACPDAQKELVEPKSLKTQTVTRGRPISYKGRSHV